MCWTLNHQNIIEMAQGHISLSEIQVDTHPFPINTIKPTCKEVLVQPEVADKGKGKNIIIGDPRTSNISPKEEIAQKTPDKETSKSRGARGHTQLRSRA
jgi:hypothetical protein